ncbi:unnamed protein product [Effrenium voratum]|nr:unnamed protein product [Effrenium voratum]
MTPMTLPAGPKRRRSLDLHFNAVMASCGSKLSDPARCNKAVEKSASSVFVQLHVEARIDEKVPPLTKQETTEFKDRFQELVVGDSKRVVTKTSRSAQYSGWKNLVQNGYMAMRPVVPKSLATTINKLNSSGEESTWKASYDPSFVKVSVAKGKTKLGFEMSKEEEEQMKNHTLSMLQEDLAQFSEEELSRDAFAQEFDVRENWPECKPITTHVRYQTCNNCWSHSTALITESRLCIESRGQKFNGDNAWLSQSFIAACRLDGRDYCMGGSGLLGFQTVSRWGVPTGGPDFRGNMKEGIETCYPQILPHDDDIRCPGACSPYAKYPRAMDKDLFYVQYQPRALHPSGTQVPHLVQQALMQDGPILLGMRIYQDFYAYESGIYRPTKKSWNLYMGGHAARDLVYVPSEGKVPFIPGTVLEVKGSEVVVEASGVKVAAPCASLRRRFGGESCQDNTSLVHLNDAAILQNLKLRHEADQIYTYTASVLLAVNPYHDIEGLYGSDQCARYRGKHIGALPPHPYAIADTAYRALVRERKNQGFIISGESGAGKTETSKIVMQYLGFISGSSDATTAGIQHRILQAQPILESFGNAVTMRNHNSSRFGKYNRIFFDDAGTLVDAGVTTYLLESSRVVLHSKSERNYHCFYEMLCGLPEAKLGDLHLARGRRYLLLANDSQEDHSDEQAWQSQFQDRDKRNFRRLCDALAVVGFTAEDMDAIFQVLAGLVHLGDLSSAERDEGDESSTVSLDEETLEKAAELLGLDCERLGAALRRRTVRVLHPGRESLHKVPRTTSQFRHALHSLIKALYKRLFDRLVQRINSSFKELRTAHLEEESRREIGILDIYGFERLERNSFEQLCINLANERLQQYFVENVLVAEQALYRREGLPWHGLQLPDAAPVVSAISHTFRILDEYSQQLAKGFEKTSDESFCQRTVDEAQKDPQRRELLRQLRMSKRRNDQPGLNEGFVIKHYAGCVEYNTKGWLDKNNDRLLPECEELIGKLAAPFRSISKKYCSDLENLLQTLGVCHLHYIRHLGRTWRVVAPHEKNPYVLRCFKPNDFQQAGVFDERLVLDQIVQCGTVELVKIMHDGYPNRCRFDEMLRFRSLLPESFHRYGTRTFIEALLLAYDVPTEDWVLGMSRLFLRAGQLKALEDLRSAGVRGGALVDLVDQLRYLKFLASLRAARAQKALASRGLLLGRLRAQLQAARLRVRERRQRALCRFRGAVRAVWLAQRLMVQAQGPEMAAAAESSAHVLAVAYQALGVGKAKAQREEERLARLEKERRQTAIEEERAAKAAQECHSIMEVPSPCRSSPTRQLRMFEPEELEPGFPARWAPVSEEDLWSGGSDLDGMEPSSLRSFFEKRCQDVEDQVERRQAELVSEMSSLMQRNEAFQSVIQSQAPVQREGRGARGVGRRSQPWPWARRPGRRKPSGVKASWRTTGGIGRSSANSSWRTCARIARAARKATVSTTWNGCRRALESWQPLRMSAFTFSANGGHSSAGICCRSSRKRPAMCDSRARPPLCRSRQMRRDDGEQRLSSQFRSQTNQE